MATRNVYDASLVNEEFVKVGDHGEFKLVELTRSRKRTFRDAMKWLEAQDQDAEPTDEQELEAAERIGDAIAAATEGSEGLGAKLRAAYEDDKISDATLARALARVISWSEEQQQVGEA